VWLKKDFKTKEKLNSWIKNNQEKYQYEEVFLCNGYSIEYRQKQTIGDEK